VLIESIAAVDVDGLLNVSVLVFSDEVVLANGQFTVAYYLVAIL
jgi:hypothetical protein